MPLSPSDDERELAALFPKPVVVQIGKLEWSISPMNLERCARFAGPMRLLLRPLVDAVEKTPSTSEPMVALIPVFMDFAGAHPKEFLEALSIAVGKPAEIIGQLPPGVVPGLVTVVAKLNADFFAASLVSHESGNTATTSNGAGVTDGQMPSISSSPAGTSTQ